MSAEKKRVTFLIKSSSTPIILKSDEKHPLNYDVYTNLIEKKMKNYYLDKESDAKDYEQTKKLLHLSKIKIKREERDFIEFITKNASSKKKNLSAKSLETINNISHFSNSNILNALRKSTTITIPKSTFYFSPIHSLSVLKLNSVIQSDIMKYNIKRQKMIYNDTMKENQSKKIQLSTNSPKIRISKIVPKFVSIPIINRVNEQNNKIKNKKLKGNNGAINYDDNDMLSLFCYYKYSIINFPESRQQFSLIISGNFLFLLGGLCSDCTLGEYWQCNLLNISWSKINCPTDSYVKFGHASVLDKTGSKIYMYGGRALYDMNMKTGKNKYLYCDLEYYDIKLGKVIKPSLINKNFVPRRRNHIAELIGNQLLVMGGVDDSDNILNDAYFINLSVIESGKGRWHELSVSGNPSPYLYGHASSFVFPKESMKDSKLSVYEFPEEPEEEKLNRRKNKLKGVFIFGGKSRFDGVFGISNDVYVLILGKKPCIWIKLDIKGERPKPRYFHSMNYYEPSNYLIVHGGRNDSQNESFALNDTYIFNLNYLQWHQVHLYSNMAKFDIFPRCGHKSVIYSNKLIIFGGMNNKNYLGSSLFIINLNPDYSPKIKTAEEIILEGMKNKENKKDEIKDLKDKINKNHKLGFVDNVNLPLIK